MSEDKKDEATLEMLLEIAATTPENMEVEPLSDVQRFIIDLDLKSGPYKVRSNVVYEIYKQWKNFNNIEPKNKFLTNFSKIFQKQKVKGLIYYYMDIENMNITEEMFDQYPNAVIRPRGYNDVKEDKKGQKGST